MARDRRLDTRLIHTGRGRELTLGGVNPVIQRASTILVERADQLYEPGRNTYGIHGTATHQALKQAMCELEGAAHCQLVPSGLLACTIPILALAGADAHILVTDNCYGPTRRFCDRTLPRWHVEVEYFDPRIGARIAALIRPETKLTFMWANVSDCLQWATLSLLATGCRRPACLTPFARNARGDRQYLAERLLVCVGYGPAEQAAENRNVLKINRTRRIAGLEPKLHLSADTANGRSSNDAFARQGAGWIGNPINCVRPNAALLVKDHGVNINFAPVLVSENKVPF